MSVYTTEFGWCEMCIKHNNVTFMDLYTSRFKFQIHKKFMKILNNISKNKFDNFEHFKKNIIKIDDHLWNLKAYSKNIVFI